MRPRNLFGASLGVLLLGLGATLPTSAVSGSVRPNAVIIRALASQQYPDVDAAEYITGTVTPATGTDYVYSQRLVNGTWSDRQGASVDHSTGNYRITIKPSQAGLYTMRVRSHWGTVISNTVQFRALATANLTDLTPVTTANVNPGSAEINGKVYANSLTGPNYFCNSADYVDYNLARHYLKFTTVVGILDTSPDPQSATSYSVIADGATIASGVVSFNHPATVSVSVASVLRLRLSELNDSPSCNNAGGSATGWGDPHIKR